MNILLKTIRFGYYFLVQFKKKHENYTRFEEKGATHQYVWKHNRIGHLYQRHDLLIQFLKGALATKWKKT